MIKDVSIWTRLWSFPLNPKRFAMLMDALDFNLGYFGGQPGLRMHDEGRGWIDK